MTPIPVPTPPTVAANPLRDALLCMARYNVWATRRLLAQVDLLAEADYRRDLGLFFKSVHGTLNHLLVVEHALWFPRLAEGVSPAVALDAELEPDRERLRSRLTDAVAAWGPLLQAWPDERLQAQLHYRRMNGQAVSLPVAPTLQHVFNHGTHHRGQITAALTALGQPAPELDLVYMLQEEQA